MKPVAYRYALRWLLVAALVLLSACNRNADAEPTPTPAPLPPPTATPQAGVVAAVGTPVVVEPTPLPVTGRITLWHGWAGAEGDALIEVLTQYADQVPGLQIATLFVAPHELPAAYAEAVRNGGGPDLVLMPNWWLADLVAAESVLPLNDLIDDETRAVYWPGALESLSYEGRLYGLPTTYSLLALYVNQTLLAGAPVAVDTVTLLDAARAEPAFGIGIYANLFHVAWGLPAYGATLFDADGRVVLDQGSGTVDYLTWLVELSTTPGSYVSSDYGMLLDRFKKGEFAYFVDGSWALADLRATLGDALRVATLPAGPVGPARPWLYSDGFLLNPTISAEQQQLALNAALAFSGPSAGSILAATGALLPAARTAVVDDPYLQGFIRQAGNAGAMPYIPEMEEVWTYGGDMIVKALTGSAPLPDIVAETAALINDANVK